MQCMNVVGGRERFQTPDRLPLHRVLHSVSRKPGGRPRESLPVKTKSNTSTQSRLQQIKCPKICLICHWGKGPSESELPALRIKHLFVGSGGGSAFGLLEVIWFVARLYSSTKVSETSDLTFAIVCNKIGPTADPFSVVSKETKEHLDSRHSHRNT